MTTTGPKAELNGDFVLRSLEVWIEEGSSLPSVCDSQSPATQPAPPVSRGAVKSITLKIDHSIMLHVTFQKHRPAKFASRLRASDITKHTMILGADLVAGNFINRW